MIHDEQCESEFTHPAASTLCRCEERAVAAPTRTLVLSDDPTRWTVHIVGPDDLYYYDTADGALDLASQILREIADEYPRKSQFYPMFRIVISPPTAIDPPAVPS